MIKAYSKRLLCPFSGQVQIVQSEHARAITLDGSNWEVQYKLDFSDVVPATPYENRNAPQQGYIRVAVIREQKLERIPLPAHLDYREVNERVDVLADYIKDLSIPLPAADHHEYWLLDEQDEKPLALIYSCVHADEMAAYPARTDWTAAPSSMMKVASIPEEEKDYSPPVNYRLEQLVNERAGAHPKARWFKRDVASIESFPDLMIRSDWHNEQDASLYQRYIERQAPRLLMLHGLEQAQRGQLEIYARQNALEVERFHSLYPEVVDDKLMSAIRVEARLRQSAGERR